MEKTMEKRNLVCAAAVSAALMLAGCGESGNSGNAQIPVAGITSANAYSFDLGTVDTTTATYYVTDRTNKSIDVVDIGSHKVTKQFQPGFFGCALYPTTAPTYVTPAPGCNPVGGVAANNDTSGPDGLDVVGAYLYVGDVGKLWVLDKTTGAVQAGSPIAIPSATAATLPVIPTTVRADEGCWDSVHNVYAISTPGDASPFVTFLNTTVNATPTVTNRVRMEDAGGPSAGLEACTFDAAGNFYVNNDGSTANAHGEIDMITRAAIVALPGGGTDVGVGGWQAALAHGSTAFALPALCDPTGIALGPRNEVGAMCRPGTLGLRMDFVILDRTTGAMIATVAGAGGGDQITYDAGNNKWYLADSRMTADQKSCGGGSATCVLTPVLAVVDGNTHAVTMMPNGNNAHSIAVGSGYAITPFNKPNATGGGAGFSLPDSTGAASGGISMFPL